MCQHFLTNDSTGKDIKPLTIKPVGRVFKSHRFTQPSDFQFLPQRTYEVKSDRVEVAAEVLERLCPLFSKKEGVMRAEGSGQKVIWDARPSRFMHKDKSTTAAHATGLFNSEIVVEAPNEARKKVKSVAYVLNAGDPIPTVPKEKHEIKRSSRKESDYTHNEVIESISMSYWMCALCGARKCWMDISCFGTRASGILSRLCCPISVTIGPRAQ